MALTDTVVAKWVAVGRRRPESPLDVSGDARFRDKTIGITRAIVFIIDGVGSAITTGEKGHVTVPWDCRVTAWHLFADQSGSIVVDIWKDTYANFPPTVADTIAGTEKPTLSSVQKNRDEDLTTWKTELNAGDVLAFNVDSITTVTRVTVQLTVITR